jgi:hypothetical protein
MTALSDTYAKARSEIIALFGWNAESLTPDQTLRLDCAVALRLALDDLQGRIVRGESIDVGRMLTSAEALAKLLPATVLASPPPAANAPDARQILWENYVAARRRGALHGEGYDGKVRRIAELEAKVAELEAALAVSGAPPSGASAPAGGNVVPLRHATSEPSARAAATPQPPKPAPPKPAEDLIDIRQGYSTGPAEPWRDFCGSGGGGS